MDKIIKFGKCQRVHSVAEPFLSVDSILLYQRIGILPAGEILMWGDIGIDRRFEEAMQKLFNESGEIDELR